LVFNDECIAAGGDSIAINELAPCELEMEQLTCHWGAVPTTSEDLVVTKDAIAGPRYDTVLRRVDPSSGSENLTDLVCLTPFRWRKGDRILVSYPNTDNQDVGFEIILKQV
jgi:hypothetical protein